MKDIIINVSGTTGHCSFGHPQAEPGPGEMCDNYKVVDIPDEVSALRVLLDFEQTIVAKRGYVVKHSEIGPGRIIT